MFARLVTGNAPVSENTRMLRDPYRNLPIPASGPPVYSRVSQISKVEREIIYAQRGQEQSRGLGTVGGKVESFIY
jgi:hypothetical protein